MKHLENSTAKEKRDNKAIITPEQKQALQDGQAPQLRFSKDKQKQCPVKQGDIIPVATSLTIEITKIIPKKTTWNINYRINDGRPRLLRQGSPRYNPRSRRHWRPDEELGYTTRPILAMSDAGEAVATSEQERQTKEAQTRWEVTHPIEMARRASRKSAVRARKGRIRRNPNNSRRRQRVSRNYRASNSTR